MPHRTADRLDIPLVESQSYQLAAYRRLGLQMSKSTQTFNGVTRYHLSEQSSMFLLFGVSEADADEDKMNNLLMRWIQDERFRQSNLQMVIARKDLEEALGQFRTKLQELCLEIEQSGG